MTKTKGWHISISNGYHAACIQHAASHMHAEWWTGCMLTSTLQEMDFLIPYGLLLVFILEAFTHQLILKFTLWAMVRP